MRKKEKRAAFANEIALTLMAGAAESRESERLPFASAYSVGETLAANNPDYADASLQPPRCGPGKFLARFLQTAKRL